MSITTELQQIVSQAQQESVGSPSRFEQLGKAYNLLYTLSKAQLKALDCEVLLGIISLYAAEVSNPELRIIDKLKLLIPLSSLLRNTRERKDITSLEKYRNTKEIFKHEIERDTPVINAKLLSYIQESEESGTIPKEGREFLNKFRILLLSNQEDLICALAGGRGKTKSLKDHPAEVAKLQARERGREAVIEALLEDEEFSVESSQKSKIFSGFTREKVPDSDVKVFKVAEDKLGDLDATAGNASSNNQEENDFDDLGDLRDSIDLAHQLQIASICQYPLGSQKPDDRQRREQESGKLSALLVGLEKVERGIIASSRNAIIKYVAKIIARVKKEKIARGEKVGREMSHVDEFDRHVKENLSLAVAISSRGYDESFGSQSKQLQRTRPEVFRLNKTLLVSDLRQSLTASSSSESALEELILRVKASGYAKPRRSDILKQWDELYQAKGRSEPLLSDIDSKLKRLGTDAKYLAWLGLVAFDASFEPKLLKVYQWVSNTLSKLTQSAIEKSARVDLSLVELPTQEDGKSHDEIFTELLGKDPLNNPERDSEFLDAQAMYAKFLAWVEKDPVVGNDKKTGKAIHLSDVRHRKMGINARQVLIYALTNYQRPEFKTEKPAKSAKTIKYSEARKLMKSYVVEYRLAEGDRVHATVEKLTRFYAETCVPLLNKSKIW